MVGSEGCGGDKKGWRGHRGNSRRVVCRLLLCDPLSGVKGKKLVRYRTWVSRVKGV